MAKTVKPPSPDHLTMTLFAPGMSMLHRAGLGGLACTTSKLQPGHTVVTVGVDGAITFICVANQ